MFQFLVDQTSVASHKSLFFVCHSGLDPESILSDLDSRFHACALKRYGAQARE